LRSDYRREGKSIVRWYRLIPFNQKVVMGIERLLRIAGERDTKE